ncbi:MAG TPA: tetratricopeptide repeat protein [Gammaproteobacteria bacterium]|nr:tetratricopeptide repeat protein [Gammaproteobacteria bacterium]
MDGKASAARVDKVTSTLADAAIAHRRGDTATAKRLYRKVLRAQPTHFKALRLSGALAHETGDIEEAIRLLGAAVRHAPADETGALEDLGLLHLQTGEQEKAESLLRRAVAINPRSLVALGRLGSTLITCGRGSEAVAVLERAREIDARDPQVAYALAHAQLESGEFARAIEAADAALALRGDDPPTLVVKGVALYQLGRYDESEEVLARAVGGDPRDVNAWIHLGRTRLKQGKTTAAVEAFTSAAELSDDLATVHSQLANVHNVLERYAEALAVCDTFLARQPTAAALILVKAIALRDSGRAAEAEALLGQDSLVIGRVIEPPPSYDDVAAFNRALERMIRGHRSLAHVHTNRATRYGIQTGSLMIDPAPEMRQLERVIDARIRAVQKELRSAGHGDHPWVRHAPTRWFINSWAVILSDQGYQLSHIHPEAWMSGVYYVKTSEDGMGPGHGEDGWIEFGSPTDQVVAKVTPPTRRVEPRPGLMVTFPSYTFHRTLPFSGRGERISIAFDVFAAPG